MRPLGLRASRSGSKRSSGDRPFGPEPPSGITEPEEDGLESAKLAAIVSSSDDAIITKTLDGTITSWNAGATNIFGYDTGEMVGQSIVRIVPPELL